jgi:CheY-like chemotaxis protein
MTNDTPTFDNRSFDDLTLERTQRPQRLDGLKIVVVEDAPDARKLLGRFLEAVGANIYMAASAAEARDLLRHFSPDVIISDIGMPDEDGLSFVRDLRAWERETGRHIPAIALTGFIGLEHRELTARAGFEAHLCKPVASDHLIDTIRKVIEAKETSLH